jgi:hypothetical protein
MEKTDKSRLLFIGIFAFLCIFDMISTYLAVSIPGVKESNALGSEILNLGFGFWGYVLFYMLLVTFAIVTLLIIEFVVWANQDRVKTGIPLWSHSFMCAMTSYFYTMLQLFAILNNLVIAFS